MKIGLALGGGGVRGLAHIPVLEMFDDLGVKPSMIAGTSMGAVVGALYASGMSGKEIRERISRYFILKADTWRDIIAKKDYLLSRCDFTMAVDVSKVRSPGKNEIPGALESVLGAFNIMQASALAQKMKHLKRDIYVQLEIQGVRMFDFGKAEEVVPESDPREPHPEIYGRKRKIDKTKVKHGRKSVKSLPRVRPMTKAALAPIMAPTQTYRKPQ